MRKPVVYLDSNVLVYHALRHPRFLSKTTQLLNKIDSGEVLGIVSIQTLGEVYNAVDRELGDPKAFEATAAIISLVNEFIATDLAAFIQARDIAQKHAVSIWDALHVALAVRAGADKIISNDTDFKKISEITVESL